MVVREKSAVPIDQSNFAYLLGRGLHRLYTYNIYNVRLC